MPYLRNLLKESARVDVVNDVYQDDSLKSHVRGLRGAGVRINKVQGSTKLPRDWNSFLRSDSNKVLLIAYLAEEVISEMKDDGKIIVFTVEDHVKSVPERSNSGLQPCNQEEADSRMFLHINDAAKYGHTSYMIRTKDTDVVVLAVAHASKNNQQIYISFGTGPSHKYIDASDIGSKLGPEKCRALMLFHAYTGCDTTSYFRSKGKKSCWTTWESFQEATPVMIKLTETTSAPDERDFGILEQFVTLLYDKNSEHSNVNKVRQHLFAAKMKPVENIPPTQAVLKHHLLRSLLQARTWYQMDRKCIDILNPVSYGWNKENNTWRPTWSDLPPIGESRVFIKCSCKDCSNTRGRGCGCGNENLPCYIGCACQGSCTRSQ